MLSEDAGERWYQLIQADGDLTMITRSLHERTFTLEDLAAERARVALEWQLPQRQPEPEPAAQPPGEFTIAWGEDMPCAGCGYFLPAGSPAWPDSDGRPLCCECAAREAAA